MTPEDNGGGDIDGGDNDGGDEGEANPNEFDDCIVTPGRDSAMIVVEPHFSSLQ